MLASVAQDFVRAPGFHSEGMREGRHVMQFAPSLQAERKSVPIAIALSLVLPGMGELYAGNFQSGKYLLAADAGLWLTYGGFQLYGDWLRRDARSFATQRAGASFENKDEQFEVNIGNFLSVEDYNEAKLRNRQFDLLYDPKSTYAWRWSSDADRLRFREQRIRSDESYRNSKFVLGALVLNRIISAFSAGRAAARGNGTQADALWRISADVSGGTFNPHGIEIQVSRSF
jgi:hypothetical protein